MGVIQGKSRVRLLRNLRDQHKHYRRCVGALVDPERYRKYRRVVARAYRRVRGWSGDPEQDPLY